MPNQLGVEVARALDQLRADLEQTFTNRLESLLVYGRHVSHGDEEAPHPPGAAPVHSLALVTSLRFADLSACAARAERWRRLNLAVPLLLTRQEFVRSLDAFPLEYGDIMARHLVVAGDSPFVGMAVTSEDRRRACEIQAKSHLIHLREGYVETAEQPAAVAALIAASAESFTRLVANVAELIGHQGAGLDDLAQAMEASAGLPADVTRGIASIALSRKVHAADAIALCPAYLDAAERLWHFVDAWKA
jgi:hypothetical protein